MKKLSLFLAVLFCITLPFAAGALAEDMPSGGIPIVVNEDWNDQPDVAVDSNGNIHVVWAKAILQTENAEIFYKMLSPAGIELIPEYQVTAPNDLYDSVRPTIAVDSTNAAFIVWQDKRVGDDPGVYICKLVPDPDGGTATETIEDTLISSEGSWGSVPRIAVDQLDNIHVVWQEVPGEMNQEDAQPLDIINAHFIMYVQFEGSPEDFNLPSVEPRPLNPPGGNFWGPYRALPDLSIDSDGRIHVTWNEVSGGNELEIYYTLLDTDGSNFLPEPGFFRMTGNDRCTSNRQSISTDDTGNAYIVWQDDRDHEVWEAEGTSWENCGTTEVYFMQVDPGDGTGEPQKTVNDTRLTELNSPEEVQPFSRMDPYGDIHVTWYKKSLVTNGGTKSNLWHMAVDQTGQVVTDSDHQISLTATSVTAWTNAHMAFPCVSPFIVWADNFDSMGTSVYRYWNTLENDTDSDAVEDNCDNCPDVPNPDQANEDGDIHGDDCDNCPEVPNPDQADLDNDAIGDACDDCTDTDGDGFGNPGYLANECEVDLCPDLYSVNNEFPDGDVNEDCVVDIPDVDELLAWLNKDLENCAACDVNGDLEITCQDLQALINIDPLLKRDRRLRLLLRKCRIR
jgi:hypothetical protein